MGASIPVWGFLQHPSAALGRGQEEGLWAAPWKGVPGTGSQCFLLAPAFPGATQYLQRNRCHLNSARAEPLQLGSCWHPAGAGQALGAQGKG